MSSALTEPQQVRVLLGSTRPAPPWSRGPALLKSLARFVRTWFKSSIERVIIYAAVGAVVGWLFNAAVIIVGYDGYSKVPVGGPATGQGNEVPGSAFCFVATAIIVAIIVRARRVGPAKFARSVRAFPRTIASLGREDSETAISHFLWGLAGSMLIVALISPWLVGVFAFGFLLALVSVFRALVTGLLMIAWRAVVHFIRRDSKAELSSAAITVGSLGGLGAVVVGLAFPDKSLELLVSMGAAAAAFFLGRRRVSALTIFLTALAGGLLLSGVVGVHANDGGFTECGRTLVNCPGLDTGMLQALVGAAAAAAGALVGAALGDATQDWDPGDGSSSPP